MADNEKKRPYDVCLFYNENLSNNRAKTSVGVLTMRLISTSLLRLGILGGWAVN